MNKYYSLLLLLVLLPLPAKLFADPPLVAFSDNEINLIKAAMAFAGSNFLLLIVNIFAKHKTIRHLTLLLIVPQVWACFAIGRYIPLWSAPGVVLIFIQLVLLLLGARRKTAPPSA